MNHRNNLHDANTQVLLMMRGPGIAAGQRVPGLAELRDLAPTVLDVAGVPVAESMEGRSLRPCLEAGGSCPELPITVSEGLMVRATATDGQRRLIVEADGSTSLWDNSGPAGQETPLEDPETAERLMAALRSEGVRGLP
jgi:hypothetical protein